MSGQFLSDILPVGYNGDARLDLVVSTASIVKEDTTNDPATTGAMLLAGTGARSVAPPVSALCATRDHGPHTIKDQTRRAFAMSFHGVVSTKPTVNQLARRSECG